MKSSRKNIKRSREPVYKYALTNLNLRSQKSTDSSIITVIPKNSKIQVIDSEDEWIKVSYGPKQGYVYSDFVSVSQHPWSNLNLREGKSTTSESLAIIPKGARVEVLEEIRDWSKVVYNDQVGYVFNYYLSNDGNPPGMLDYTDFYTDMTKFVNENNVKSTNNYLITTDLLNKYTYIFKRDNGNWVQLYKWQCTVGKPETPTITGMFYINGRKPSFGTDEYMVKYATRIKDGYYYHSILYDATGTYVIDPRLGEAISHGCVRLDTANAKWIYENILDTTTVVIH
ncbi:L,D-transpeptidase family protein [[Clostridium] dakarense]|uniref:L,D-transpeptidase family protein n=1 Tax=Faecalimicrobium dakarense TaxID=1301100 RepID=UPI0004AF4F71|nr:SH3 domain-containing protein [[Clostridium] dakarense]